VSPEGDKKGRTYPDVFWSALCEIQHFIPPAQVGMVATSIRISIRAVLVGAMLLSVEPLLLGNKSKLSQQIIKTVHQMQISVDHTMKDLCPDFKRFAVFVKNCERNCLRFKYHPFSDEMDERKRQEQLGKIALCRQFKMEAVNEGIDENIELKISQSIRNGKLLPILRVGAKRPLPGY
jgi:hypothetical protein